MNRRIVKLLIAGSFMHILLQGCDKIEEGKYRQVTGAPDTTKGIDTTKYYRKVLLEDFTGHQCGNCPPANAEATRLQGVYGHQLIVMSVHAGYYAKTAAPNYLYKFNIPEGEEINSFFGIIGNPSGMINRSQFSTKNHIRPYLTWASVIDTMVKKEPLVNIKISNTFNTTSLSLQSNVKIEYLSSLPGAYKVVLFLTEDSIVKYQTWYNHTPKDVPDYVHRHVLRALVNSTFGETISVDPAKGGSVSKTFTYTLKSEWKAKHCSVIAIVYRETDFEIIQAEEKHIMP
jgi:hypothetical protein